MAKKKLIIVEGPRGTGKTTVTNWLREQLPSTNLYRLSGTDDKTTWGKVKSDRMYKGLIEYMKSLENMGMNLVFDRMWFSEEVFCRLGMKEYKFTDEHNNLNLKLAYMKFDVYIICLVADPDTIVDRLKRDKADYQGDGFNIENIKREMNTYIDIVTEFSRKYPWVSVSLLGTDGGDWKKSLGEIIDLPTHR